MTLPALRGRPAPHGKASRVAGVPSGARVRDTAMRRPARQSRVIDVAPPTWANRSMGTGENLPIRRGRKTARLGPIGRRIQADTSATATTMRMAGQIYLNDARQAFVHTISFTRSGSSWMRCCRAAS